MAITVKINIDWSRVEEEMFKKIDERVLQAFYLACHDAVIYAKTKHGYTQQSGALNSSTGFQLYKDGTLVDSYFEQSGGGDDRDGAKARGIAAGQKTARQRAAELRARICGIVVAGMPYAVHVEDNNRDVLTGASLQFPKMIERRMKEAFKNENITYSIIV
jgi:hypothetical protein